MTHVSVLLVLALAACTPLISKFVNCEPLWDAEHVCNKSITVRKEET